MWEQSNRFGLSSSANANEVRPFFSISAELEELMNLADRIAVMFEGRIVGILDAANVTTEKLGLMISGLSADA